MDDVVRQARPEDVPAMHYVRGAVRENVLPPHVVIPEADTLEATTTLGRGWVAEADGQVVGFAIGKRSGEVWALFVDPAHEGRGHGRRLHEAMLAWLWAEGVEALWLTTLPGTRAERFYRRAGWTDAGAAPKNQIRFERRRPEAPAPGGRDGPA